MKEVQFKFYVLNDKIWNVILIQNKNWNAGNVYLPKTKRCFVS